MDVAETNGITSIARELATHAAVLDDRDWGRPTFLASHLTRIETDDIDELSAALLDWSVEWTQLRPGAFSGALTVIPLGPVLIVRGRCNQALLQRGSPPDDCLTVYRPARGSEAITVRGHELRNGEVLVAGPDAQAEFVNRGLHLSVALSINIEFLRSQTNWIDGIMLQHQGQQRLHSPGVEWVNGFLEAIDWITAAAERYEHGSARPDVNGALVDALLARVDALHAARSPLSHDREMRAARRLAVGRALDYIRVNLSEPIRLSELCRHARTQPRSLEYGFREVMGVTPITYVRTARLHRVRRLLQSTAVRNRSISEIALDCGFWHLSQFSMDYKNLFAESPSTTYRRTQARLPRAQRRRATLRAPSVASLIGSLRGASCRSLDPDLRAPGALATSAP